MTTSLLERTATAGTRTTCQVYAGTLLAPCPNPATRRVVRAAGERRVCPAHA
ncbi:MAG TPA: hypothetical protein VNU66_03740 [Mycobacteriales bacterium]|nr:hypothetical protein [Mycobacteriales bacterium]